MIKYSLMAEHNLHLQRSILLTTSYAEQFSYPLSLVELWRRLIVKTIETQSQENKAVSSPSLSEIENGVKELVGRGLLFTDGFYFALSQCSLKDNREEKSARAQIKWREAQNLVHIISWLPWISGVAVTGSLAVDNVKQNDDIDFLLVTKSNRLWLTRIVISFLAFIAGKRRSWHQEEPNSWCFNLWLDTDHLYISKHDVYTAHEVCQTQWLLSKDSTSEIFLNQNKWAATFLPHYYVHQKRQPLLHFDRFFDCKIVGISQLFDLLNWLVYLAQRLYMIPHKTTEKVDLGFAFFHPRNTRKIIFDGWKNILQNEINKNKL